MAQSRVLVVDDQPVVRALLLELLQRDGRIVLGAATVKEAVEVASAHEPLDVALVDRDLPDGSGVALARTLMARHPHLEVILTSVSPTVQSAIEAVEVGAHDYLAKPFEDISQVEVRVRRAEHQARLQRERESLDAALRKSEERYRKLFGASPDAIVVYETASGVVQDVNEAACRLYHLTRAQLVGANIASLRDNSPISRPSELPPDSSGFRQEGVIARVDRRADGRKLDVEVSFGRFGEDTQSMTIEVIRDVRERIRAEQNRKDLEAQLRQAQKMEALGLLAGGIAHDFNNLLAVITNYAAFARDQLRKRGDADSLTREIDDVGQILQAANSAASVTRQLLAFSRREVHSPEILNINDVITTIEKLLRHTLGEHVNLFTELADGLPVVRVDRGQFEQVLINLIVNARDALPDGGRVEVRTEFVEGGQADGSVVLSVTDSGTGIAEANLDRVFDPFFTTKGPGRGTGLGLSTVKGIVEQAGGRISVTSTLGAGTIFYVSLPPTQEVQIRRPKPVARTRSLGGETVLLVDDDTAVRKAAERILEGAGYRIVAAQSGAEALAQHERQGDRVDLLLTDVMMPKMSGDELADMLLARQPDLKVVFLTGFASQGLVDRVSRDTRMALQLKPFDNDGLLTLVREMLDARAGSTVPTLPPGHGEKEAP